jgi:hypothetical protein
LHHGSPLQLLGTIYMYPAKLLDLLILLSEAGSVVLTNLDSRRALFLHVQCDKSSLNTLLF